MKPELDSSWLPYLGPEFEKPYMQELNSFLSGEQRQGHKVYPPSNLTFKALSLTGLDRVKAVILGQDPYYRPGQAMGLAFSVPEGVAIPASLRQILKEVQNDVGIPYPPNGDLTPWAESVLLLNTILTVREGEAGSHAGKGWEKFTDQVIRTVSTEREGVVFLLWGRHARAKKELIDTAKHLVLEAAHPSPLARTGFLGCKHFSKANEYLQEAGADPIDWSLDPAQTTP